MSALEECTTNARQRKHLCPDMRPFAVTAGFMSYPGRWGQTLCGQRCYDQEFMDAERRYGGTSVVVAELPSCRSCERSRPRWESGPIADPVHDGYVDRAAEARADQRDEDGVR